MANQIQFDLASPQKLIFSKPVSMVSVPGSDGVFAVLSGHALMDTGIAMGVLDVYETDQQTVTERYFVAGGFCEVTGDYCTVMANEAVLLSSLKKNELEEELKLLIFEDKTQDTLWRIAVAEAKLQVVR